MIIIRSSKEKHMKTLQSVQVRAQGLTILYQCPASVGTSVLSKGHCTCMLQRMEIRMIAAHGTTCNDLSESYRPA